MGPGDYNPAFALQEKKPTVPSFQIKEGDYRSMKNKERKRLDELLTGVGIQS